ncbi:MAG: cupin domain-containing protein [Bacteroidetes bacterium]|nr:cupin domain-containing protein [Bacteroidota bacterium]MBK9518086.1 cupin domain-containing protein [Anaeromyxobacter sp.]MBL0276337.1 cupin domain-containing protein [Anaeromyxobacter sp.]
MPVIDREQLPVLTGSKYPAPFDAPCRARTFRRLGEAGGLTRLGVSECTLPPGAWSSQRHWHAEEDEFLWMLEGELVLVTDEGEQVVRAGDCAAFPAGSRNGHCLQNRSSAPARFLAVSNRDDRDRGEYPDLDLAFTAGRYTGGSRYVHKDGTPYPP